jgi:hypothetical protein
MALMSAVMLSFGCSRAAVPSIGLSTSPAEPRELTVSGLDERVLNAFTELDATKQREALRILVADAPPEAPPLSGTIERRGAELVFVPRYPFQPGVKYRARFHLAVDGVSASARQTEFMLPAPPQDPVHRVVAIYPSSDELPENLLRFYIHFSGPMSRGEAYRHVRLLDDAGQTVSAPFLELGEELWNPEMTRFTLFFDPGRIKQGLVPRLEMGPALESGRSYTLIVDKDWEDSQHRALIESAKKVFRAGPADAVQPDPSRWRITSPAGGSTENLTIQFEEPLDEALLERVLTVRDSGGLQIAGKVSISDHERLWSFTPKHPWQVGRHVIEVETILEDAAGNSIGRPFEVDLHQESKPAAATIEIPFDVGAGS